MGAWIGLLCAAFGAGVLIGTVGVGGILLIPALAYFAHIPIQTAMATALFTFIFTGLVGAYQFQRRGSIDWGNAIPVNIGALFSGYLGALLNAHVNGRWLNFLLALVILFSGLYTLYASRRLSVKGFSARTTGRMGLVLIGAVVGFISGLTGVGGPVISVPLMVILGFSPLLAIATSQVLQIVAGISGTIGNLAYGHILFGLAGWVGLTEIVGVYIGSHLAHAANMQQLRVVVAAVCILVGIGIILRTQFLGS